MGIKSVRWILLAAALAPAAIGVAQEAPPPNPCDPVKIDLVTLVPEGQEFIVNLTTAVLTRNAARITAVVADGTGQTTETSGIATLTPSSSTIAIADATTGEVTTIVETTAASADSISAAADGTQAFVTSSTQNTLTVLDAVIGGSGELTLTEAGTIVVGDTPIRTEAIPGTTLVVVVRSGGLDVVDTASMTVVGTVELSGDPVGIAALNDPSLVAVTLAEGTAALVNIDTATVVATVVVGAGPPDITLCRPPAGEPGVGDRLLVTDPATGITVIDPDTFTVIDVVDSTLEDPSRISNGGVIIQPPPEPDPVPGPGPPPEPTPIVDLAFVINGTNVISVIDCNLENAETFLKEIAQIVVNGTALEVVSGPPGADPRTFVGRIDRESLLVVDPFCFVDPRPRIDSLDVSSGPPGTFVTVTGSFPPDTAFIVDVFDFPFAYVTPLSVSGDLTEATFEIPLTLPPNADVTIYATSSSETAVISDGNFLRFSPTPFETRDVVGGIQDLIAALQSIADDPATPNKAAKQIDKVIDQLQKALAQLAKGDIDEALEHFQEAFEHLQEAEEKGADVGRLPTRLLEIVQFLVFQKLSALEATLGVEDALIAEAQIEFDTARALLLNGDLEGALESFEDAADELEDAIEKARTISREDTELVMATSLDAVFDIVEILGALEPLLNLSPNQKKKLNKAISHLGPRPNGSFADTAIGKLTEPDMGAAFAHIRQATKRLESLVNQGVPIGPQLKEFLRRLIVLAQFSADRTESNVGPFDETVVKARAAIELALSNLNPNFLSVSVSMQSAMSALTFTSAPDPLGNLSVTPISVPDVLQGSDMQIQYSLDRAPPADGYFRLRIKQNPFVATVEEGLFSPGTFTSVWNTTNYLGNLVDPGSYEAEFIYFFLFVPNGFNVSATESFLVLASGAGPINEGPATTGDLEIQIFNTPVTIDDVVGLKDINEDGFDAPDILCRIRHTNSFVSDPALESVVIRNISEGGDVGYPNLTDPIVVQVPLTGEFKTFVIRGLKKSTQKGDAVIFAHFLDEPFNANIPFMRGGKVKATVVEMDIDIDSDNNGTIEETEGPEDKIELQDGASGTHVFINSDDDDGDTVTDSGDAQVNGAADRNNDMVRIRIRRVPAGLNVGKVRIKVNTAASNHKIRLFDHNDAGVLGPSPGPSAIVKEIPLAQLQQDRTFHVEGTLPSSVGQVRITIEYVRAGGNEILARDVIQLTVIQILEISWQGVNPGDGQTGFFPDGNPASHGSDDLIFPGKSAPGAGNPNHRNIDIRVAITPILSGVNLFFTVHDIDDIFTDEAPMDSNGTAGGDNHNDGAAPPAGPAHRLLLMGIRTGEHRTEAGALIGATPANQARLRFMVSMNPGDNYRAAVHGNAVDAVNVRTTQSGLAQTTPAPGIVHVINAQQTKRLAVWRKLHIEVDSMEGTDATIPSPAATVGPFADDVSMGNVPDPIKPGDYAAVLNSAFAPFYIVPAQDTGNDTPLTTWVHDFDADNPANLNDTSDLTAYVLGADGGGVGAGFKGTPDNDPQYWAVYIIGIYEDHIQEFDNDPITEFAGGGTTRVAVNAASEAAGTGGEYSAISMEIFRDIALEKDLNLMQRFRMRTYNNLHELGHQFGLSAGLPGGHQASDTSIMWAANSDGTGPTEFRRATVALTFTPADVDQVRSFRMLLDGTALDVP